MARHLGRTNRSVELQMARHGLRGYRAAASDWMTVNTVYKVTGVSKAKTLGKWAKNGLRVRYVGCCRMIAQEDLVRYMKRHQDDWTASAVSDDSIFAGEKWYLDKQERDSHSRDGLGWSAGEISILKSRYRQGIRIRLIAEELHRSYDSTRHRICRLRTEEGWKL